MPLPFPEYLVLLMFAGSRGVIFSNGVVTGRVGGKDKEFRGIGMECQRVWGVVNTITVYCMYETVKKKKEILLGEVARKKKP